MANHKSALKRARQSETRRQRNKTNRTKVKNMVKTAREAATHSPEQAATALKGAMQALDRAANKGAIHRRTASRRISRLARHIFKAQQPEA